MNYTSSARDPPKPFAKFILPGCGWYLGSRADFGDYDWRTRVSDRSRVYQSITFSPRSFPKWWINRIDRNIDLRNIGVVICHIRLPIEFFARSVGKKKLNHDDSFEQTWHWHVQSPWCSIVAGKAPALASSTTQRNGITGDFLFKRRDGPDFAGLGIWLPGYTKTYVHIRYSSFVWIPLSSVIYGL